MTQITHTYSYKTHTYNSCKREFPSFKDVTTHALLYIDGKS